MIALSLPTSDLWNLKTTYEVTPEQILKACEESFHLRAPYYSDKVFRVPIPATHSGHVAYYSGIYKVASCKVFKQNTSPLNQAESVINTVNVNKSAKYVEALVGEKAVIKELGFETEGEYGLFAVRSSSYSKVILPTVFELEKLMKIKHFKVTADDILQSGIFWAHHVLVI